MGKGVVTKVMKYELRYLDGCGDFHEMQEAVWKLQKQSREVLNKTLQIAVHWDFNSKKHFDETGEYLDVLTETGYKRLDGYIYDCLKDEYCDMAADNLNAAIQKAWKKYKGSKLDVMRGMMSLPSYKSNQPILINIKCIKLYKEEKEAFAEFTLFSNKYKKTHGYKSNVKFTVLISDGTQRSIYNELISKNYKLGVCQLVYDKKKWFLYLTYNFTPLTTSLDSEKILGVDLGESKAIYASSTSSYGRFYIEGGEVTAFAKQLENRKHSLQKQAVYCGEGRIGHGTKTRVSDVYKAEDKIANFRSTINHRYSKALIDYAVKGGFGTIQMEDLSGIKEDTGFPRRLQHWTYYDLQSKIEAKASEKGIKVVKIDPKYTSQRCSKCGNIDKNNRPSQEKFCCTVCRFSCNADFNASQNISIKNIEKIISETKSANME